MFHINGMICSSCLPAPLVVLGEARMGNCSFKFYAMLKVLATLGTLGHFFFFISKNVIYMNGYSMHEEHRANPENTRRKKTKKKQKRKSIHRLITKRKRAKERRERITSRESPSPRPIKKSPTKRSKHLITETIQILKSLPIPFLPNTPKDAQWN